LAAAVEALDHFAFMPDSALIGGAGSVPSNLVLPTDVASELGAIQSPDAVGGGGLDFWGSFINF
jgi:hypothetical protein